MREGGREREKEGGRNLVAANEELAAHRVEFVLKLPLLKYDTNGSNLFWFSPI